jgi:ubiquinone/menaquinone biosynthesis C-methylase UbiE
VTRAQELRSALLRRFARVATNVVVRRPALWRLFRGPIERQFHRVAPEWDQITQPDHLAAYEAALAAIEPAPRQVLDLGTGTGIGAFALARTFPEAEIVGVDLAEGMLAEARGKTPPELAGRVRFQRADAAALPFGGGSFDLVAHANMIPFFDELARVTKPGGWALFSFSGGAETPIYVAPERLRRELAPRGFEDFADFSAGRGTALLARKRRAG